MSKATKVKEAKLVYASNPFRYSTTQLQTPAGPILFKVNHETGEMWVLKGEKFELMKE